MTEYHIVENSNKGYQPYGAAVDLWKYKDRQVIIDGPADTGKTLACLQKLDALMWKYPKAQGVLVRKSYKSTVGSCVQSLTDEVWNKNTPIVAYGGNKPEWFDYPNGSRLWVGGMDNPDKVLSTQRDIICVNQVEELELDEWEYLTTRATGRAGNIPFGQVMGDCNPSYPHHWIKHRDSLKLFHSRHEDNPTIYNRDGTLTPNGVERIAALDDLTGVRKERLRYGRWVQAEGAIYPQYDDRVHHIDRFDIPADWQRLRVIDFGLKNPFVCGWWAVDEDGRAYLYREIYMTGRTVTVHAKQINELSKDETIYETICDHDASDRATLAENGIPNIPAKKDVEEGIGRVQDRLKVQADDKPRIFFLRDSLVEIDQTLREQRKPIQTTDEFGGYIWKDKALKEQPLKQDDHGVDMTRYTVMYLDAKKQWGGGWLTV